jgi:hypothetical protein
MNDFCLIITLSQMVNGEIVQRYAEFFVDEFILILLCHAICSGSYAFFAQCCWIWIYILDNVGSGTRLEKNSKIGHEPGGLGAVI